MLMGLQYNFAISKIEFRNELKFYIDLGIQNINDLFLKFFVKHFFRLISVSKLVQHVQY